LPRNRRLPERVVDARPGRRRFLLAIVVEIHGMGDIGVGGDVAKRR
jgi:hypothetical protein